MITTLRIPCKKHVKKYLIEKYGTSHTISKTTLLGMFTLEFLHKDFKPELKEFDFDDVYIIQINTFYFNTKGHTISRAKKRMIGACMERLFREDIFAFVDMQIIINNTTAIDSLRFFLKHYDIQEDDLKIESIYKAYKRYKGFDIKGLKKQKNHQNTRYDKGCLGTL